MATSGRNTTSNNAPNINLSALIDESREDCPKELCPLCRSRKRSFNCESCIRNGDFVHSSSRCPERFADKQIAVRRVNEKKQLVQSKCEKILLVRKQRDILKVEIEACQNRVKLLKVLLKATSDRMNEHESKRQKLAEDCRSRSQRYPRYESRIEKTNARLNTEKENIENRKARVNEMQKKLKAKIRANVRHIMQYIFPIKTVLPSRSMCSSEEGQEAKIKAVLADACRTMYIRGRWVFTDSGGELQHCIVGPTLPGLGDYSAYNDWTETENQCPNNGDRTLSKCGASISAAITYTIQLTDLLSFYLDVPLPCKLNYSDFCGAVLNEQQFARRVARLNWNVLQLCFSQNVDIEILHPSHTLQNILHLINPEVSDIGRWCLYKVSLDLCLFDMFDLNEIPYTLLGRLRTGLESPYVLRWTKVSYPRGLMFTVPGGRGPIIVDPQMASALEDQLQRDLAQDNYGTDSDAESDVLPTEWEAVPHTLDIPSITPAQISQQMTSTQPSASVGGGLVTSIASVFRGWTSKR